MQYHKYRPMSADSLPVLRSLTALRFPAALAVFLSHAPLTREPALMLSAGYSGVGFFFLLSGFILTYAYSGAFTLRSFYTARIARVYPVHLFAMVFAIFALAVAGGGPEWNDATLHERLAAIALQSVLLQSWFPSAHIHFSANGPAWSLSDEAFFYALFPFMLGAFVHAFRRARAGMILVAAATVWLLLFASLAHVHARFDEWAIYVLPLTRCIDFAAGMLLGLAFLRRPQRSTGDGTVLEVGVLCALALGVALTAYAPQSLQFSAAMMPFSAATIFVFAMQRGALSKALSWAPLVRLGEASYAFYLMHRPIVELTGYFHISGVAGFVFSLAASVLVSLAVYRWLETPMRRAIRSLSAPQQGVAAAMQTA